MGRLLGGFEEVVGKMPGGRREVGGRLLGGCNEVDYILRPGNLSLN